MFKVSERICSIIMNHLVSEMVQKDSLAIPFCSPSATFEKLQLKRGERGGRSLQAREARLTRVKTTMTERENKTSFLQRNKDKRTKTRTA